MHRLIFVPILFIFAFSINASELSPEQRANIESRIKPVGKVCLLGQTNCGAMPVSDVSTMSSGSTSFSEAHDSSSSSGESNEGCNLEIEAGDSLQFNLASMSVSASCPDVSITLRHTGNMPASAMGHNWVLTKEADVTAVASDGANAGIDSNYVKPGDVRVIAYTSLIGGGEATSITFSAAMLNPDSEYTFFCSFPGHSFVMRGSFRVT